MIAGGQLIVKRRDFALKEANLPSFTPFLSKQPVFRQGVAAAPAKGWQPNAKRVLDTN
jgi:hypothetical protein